MSVFSLSDWDLLLDLGALGPRFLAQSFVLRWRNLGLSLRLEGARGVELCLIT